MSNALNQRKYRKFVSPSQFAAILGYDQYLTQENVKQEIEEGYLTYNNFATDYGKNNEYIGLYFYQKIHKVTISRPKFVIDKYNNRIGGICDGIIDDDVGIEIKCHVCLRNLLTILPLKYLIQMAGYMYLYNKKKWILMSCFFHDDNNLSKYNIFEVHWDEVKDRWNQQWYPQLTNFINQVKWKN